MSKSFLTSMKVEVLIDSDTLEYQADIDGEVNTIIAVLEAIVADLKDPETLESMTIED